MVYLLQDGIAIDSLTPVNCIGTFDMWTALPFGHTYQTQVADHSQCGSFGTAPVVTAFTSGQSQMMLTIQDANGTSGGNITVSDVLVDPLSPLPPPDPFTGYQIGTNAYWADLVPGEYDVNFYPDSICDQVDSVVTVSSATGINEVDESSLLVWPQPVRDILHWRSSRHGFVRVFDAQGRLVLKGPNVGQLDLARMPAGLYQLQIIEGSRARQSRFLKQ